MQVCEILCCLCLFYIRPYSVYCDVSLLYTYFRIVCLSVNASSTLHIKHILSNQTDEHFGL
jgi:hypothetical protein